MRHTPSILLIDRQKSWRNRSARALRSAGFQVRTVDTYENNGRRHNCIPYEPDLVVLGCAKIGEEERAIAQQILDHHHPLLVFSSTLSSPEMRTLFRMGARDVETKTFDRDRLVTTVKKVLHSIRPRDHYEAMGMEVRK